MATKSPKKPAAKPAAKAALARAPIVPKQKHISTEKNLSSAKKSAGKPQTGALSGKIPKEQWDMPVGFKEDGKTLATLREFVNPHIVTLSLPDLSAEKRKTLIVDRLEQRPDFTLHMIGSGVVDKARAIEEVKAQTAAGKVIEEIEQRVINNMIEKARNQKEG